LSAATAAVAAATANVTLDLTANSPTKKRSLSLIQKEQRPMSMPRKKSTKSKLLFLTAQQKLNLLDQLDRKEITISGIVSKHGVHRNS
jgi:hypothetical protein